MPAHFTPRVTVVCPVCGTTFQAGRWARRRYCSQSCYHAAPRRSAVAVADRFWPKVDKSGDCWLWTGGAAEGYGRIQIGNRSHRAHRVAWELTNGPIPDGLLVCHDCDNPLCVRPDHLFLGTQSDNMADMTAKGRHPYHYGDDHSARRKPETLARGTHNGQARLTDDAVRTIRAEYAAGGISQATLGKRYGVSQAVISAVVRRKWWRHVE